MSFTFVADCIAVGLPLAQAVGRLGNWFNNELYGGPTTLPWGLEVHRMSSGGPGNPPVGQAMTVDGQPVLEPGLYHPTFLYELLWNLGVAGLVFWLDRKYKFGKGRAFALYVMAYTAGRAWIEAMRTDEAEIILGQRLNVWVSLLVFLGALAYFVTVKGPQEFVIPALDGKGFQSVTEAEFHDYQVNGPAEAVASDDDGSGEGNASPGAGSDTSGPDASGADGEPDAAAREEAHEATAKKD
jgi:hypothetical protein